MVYVNLGNDKNISLISFNHHNRRCAVVAAYGLRRSLQLVQSTHSTRSPIPVLMYAFQIKSRGGPSGSIQKEVYSKHIPSMDYENFVHF